MGSWRLSLLIVASRPLNLNVGAISLWPLCLLKGFVVALIKRSQTVTYERCCLFSRPEKSMWPCYGDCPFLIIFFLNEISLSFLLRFSHLLCQMRRRSLEVYVWNVFDSVSEFFLLLDPFKAVHSVYVCIKAGLQCTSLWECKPLALPVHFSPQ